ncbi:MAG: polynucleotide kinase-phosphatase [Tessaracoccus sp.]|uniref:polynucleotide kinase-phosphatase n=1 Tax=Tessaracoccus sp. TaxID=1971211 RepID=UPI001EC94B99|nr:polynucleotide kinase-phosphatase [Tessaracoccus sp.]MBK7820383.1 polynucleotide kinase-phosphatase [Tessaracoccus sp.]
MTELHIPGLSLVVLIGASGSGKTTFARRAFAPFEVISSDYCRALVSGDENDQSASGDAFDVLHYIAGKRLDRGLLTVVDATNVSRESRAALVQVARDHDVLPVAIVLDVPLEVALERNATRPDRDFGPGPVKRQATMLRKSLRGLGREGFRSVHVLRSVDEVDAATVVRDRLLNDYSDQHGPFDIVGDVHGCLDELLALFGVLGYEIRRDDQGRAVDAEHPAGRRVVFVGDLVDRGPSSVGVLRLAMGMTAAGHALAVPGNHEAKLVRALDGRKVQATHGLETTLAELAEEPQEFRDEVREWCRGLVSHLVLDDRRLVVAHAGLKEAYHGRASGRVRSFALYGDTTGETDEYGLPVRYPWAEEYRGRAMVVYGHTPTPTLEWINNTLCLDTGCVFGGSLSALRYPERETVQVPATEVHYEPAKPFLTSAPQRGEDELRLTDVVGRRSVETETMGRVTITAENAAGALEVMSRFALHPRLVPYLPPTMSPVATSTRGGYLEHPDEAFAQYAEWGIGQVLCEEKHMGSRAVVYLTPDGGSVYTRTGRAFFDANLTTHLLDRVRAAVRESGIDRELDTDWLLLDAELLPWSVKSQGLLREQYAPVGSSALLALPPAVEALATAQARGVDVEALLRRTESRLANARAYDAAWQRYVWPTNGLDGVQLAVFQVLAGKVSSYADRDHLWHLDLADRLVAADPGLFRHTRRRVVDTRDAASRADGIAWWEELTADGGEGMVVKPLANLVRTSKGKAPQPGLKVRGREYLRIIYGPDYTEPENLERLRQRNLGRKRSLALREYALGLEAVQRLVAGEPLWRIHEAVFGVLALESEPVDPRL